MLPTATMKVWGMGTRVGHNALLQLDVRNLHTICSLKALYGILQHRADMLEQLVKPRDFDLPLIGLCGGQYFDGIGLRDGETMISVQPSYAFGCQVRVCVQTAARRSQQPIWKSTA